MFQPQSQKWTPRIELPIPKPSVTNQILSIEIIFKGFWIMSPELDAGWFTNFRHPCDGFSKIWLGFCILRWIRELTHCRVSPLFQHDQNPSSLSKLHRSKQLWVSTVILGGVFVQFDAKCATPYLSLPLVLASRKSHIKSDSISPVYYLIVLYFMHRSKQTKLLNTFYDQARTIWSPK